MNKSKREFFEVFRRLPEKDDSRAGWLKKPEPLRDRKEEEPAGDAPAGPAPKRDAGPLRNRLVLSFSRETLVVIAVVWAGTLAASFVWGHSYGVGRRPAVAAAQSPTSEVPKTAALSLQEPKRLQPPYFTLRVMKDIPLRNAQEVAADLRAMGYDAFVLQTRSLCSVNVGRYADYRTVDAKVFKERVNALVYKNQRWFTSCSWQKVTGQGSVER